MQKKFQDKIHITFPEDNTHIIQMNRDKDLNCQQFDDTDALISYLNSIPQSRIKNNTMSFETEQSIKDDIEEYNAEKEKAEKEKVEKDPSLNNKDKLIIGYAYGDNDTQTQSKKLNDMKYCVNMNSGENAFGKEYLKDDHEIEVIFHNSQIVGKTLNTGRVTVNRFIKKIDTDKYAIIYKRRYS